jgi:hypothetical protein
MKKKDESNTSETNTDLIAQSSLAMQEKEVKEEDEYEEAGEEEEEEDDEQQPHYSNLLPIGINLPLPPPMLIKRRASESDDQPTTKVSKLTPQNGEPDLSEQSSSITEPKSAQIIAQMKNMQLRISSLFGKFDECYNDIRQISTEFEGLVSSAESIL